MLNNNNKWPNQFEKNQWKLVNSKKKNQVIINGNNFMLINNECAAKVWSNRRDWFIQSIISDGLITLAFTEHSLFQNYMIIFIYLIVFIINGFSCLLNAFSNQFELILIELTTDRILLILDTHFIWLFRCIFLV